MDILAQIVGIIAMGLSAVSFQMKDKKTLMTVQILTAIAFGIHYIMIGAYTGAVLNFAAVVRNVMFFFRDRKFFSGNVWVVFWCVAMAGLSVWAWTDWRSALTMIGMILNTISLSMKDPQKVRGVILTSFPFGFAYCVLTRSIGGTINEILAAISAAVGLYRYRRNDRSLM